LRQERREAAAAGDLALASWAMAGRAQVELGQGRMRMARRRAEAARQLAHRHHAPHAETAALGVLAELALRSEDWEGALVAATAGAAAAERAGDHQPLAWLLVSLSAAQARLGRVGQARETAARVLEVARQAGSRIHEGWAELRLAGLWATDPPVAEAHLLRGLAIARQLDHHEMEARCRVRLADLARDQGELRGARAELGQAARLAGALDDPHVAATVWQGWALLAEAQGLPGGQAALLWALAAVHGEQAGSPVASSFWEKAERTAAAAGEPGGRADLAARAQATLAPDGERGLLHKIFGPFRTDHLGDGEAAPGA
jgi:hypothetical protein